LAGSTAKDVAIEKGPGIVDEVDCDREPISGITDASVSEGSVFCVDVLDCDVACVIEDDGCTEGTELTDCGRDMGEFEGVVEGVVGGVDVFDFAGAKLISLAARCHTDETCIPQTIHTHSSYDHRKTGKPHEPGKA